MVEAGKFVGCLKSCGIGFFAGVPVSRLKSFCVHVTDTYRKNHGIATEENGADGWPARKSGYAI